MGAMAAAPASFPQAKAVDVYLRGVVIIGIDREI
jgi:hypothetical protein